jgi:hypothetical protein
LQATSHSISLTSNEVGDKTRGIAPLVFLPWVKFSTDCQDGVELRNAVYADERHCILNELAAAEARLAAKEAAFEAQLKAEPPE